MRAFLLALLLLALAACAEDGANQQGADGTASADPTWASVDAIFSGGCGCHPTVSTDLSYASLISDNSVTCATTSVMITAGNRSASCLYLSVIGADGNNMSSFLTASQAETVGSWIDAGAPGP